MSSVEHKGALLLHMKSHYVWKTKVQYYIYAQYICMYMYVCMYIFNLTYVRKSILSILLTFIVG